MPLLGSVVEPRDVFDRTPERSDRVERRAQRIDTGATDPTDRPVARVRSTCSTTEYTGGCHADIEDSEVSFSIVQATDFFLDLNFSSFALVRHSLCAVLPLFSCSSFSFRFFIFWIHNGAQVQHVLRSWLICL